MEMIYHKLAYLLILHHWDHMHNMNHKDFSRVVTGFRIKVGNIWECSSKAIETSGAKMNQLKLEYIHVKPIIPFSSFFNLTFKAFKPCKTPALKKRSFKRNTSFAAGNDPSQQLPPSIYHV
jgi:hypothetical protein